MFDELLYSSVGLKQILASNTAVGYPTPRYGGTPRITRKPYGRRARIHRRVCRETTQWSFQWPVPRAGANIQTHRPCSRRVYMASSEHIAGGRAGPRTRAENRNTAGCRRLRQPRSLRSTPTLHVRTNFTPMATYRDRPGYCYVIYEVYYWSSTERRRPRRWTKTTQRKRFRHPKHRCSCWEIRE